MQLEKRLGTRLLNRTSRRVSLSESGALYFEQARQMLDSLDEVEAAVSNATVVPHEAKAAMLDEVARMLWRAVLLQIGRRSAE